MLQLVPRHNYVHLPVSGRSEKELYIHSRTICLLGSFLGNPSRWHRNKREVFSTSFLWMSILSCECLTSCPTSCSACIFQVYNKHLCHSGLRADQSMGFSQNHHKKYLIKLNKDEFLYGRGGKRSPI